MKILYVASAITLPGTSGGATHVLEVAGGLARRGHQVHVVARGKQPRPQSAIRNPQFTLLPWPPLLAYLGLPAVWRLAGRFRPDLIMERYYNFAGTGLTVAKRRRIPAVLEVNAPMVDPPGSAKTRLDRLLGGRLRHYAVAQALWSRRIITPLATTVPPEVPRDWIEIVNWGANVAQFRPDLLDPTARAALRREYGIGEDAVVVAFVGSFRAWHGADVFADVALQLIPQQPHLAFLAIGGGPELATVRARVAQAGLPPGRFVLTGPQPHERVPGLLALADVGVAPFVPAAYAPLRTFGFYWSPLKVFEYMAAGLPVVTLDIPPLNTMIRAGQEGLHYAEGDTAALAAHLRTLAADPILRERLGAAARARVIAHYSWDAHCAQLERVLEEARHV